MDILNIVNDITKSIKKQNLDAEVVIYETNKISVSQRLLKIEQISQAKNCTVGIRAIAEKDRAAYVSTNDLSSIDKVISQVVEMAKSAQRDPYINFYVDDHHTTENLGILDTNSINIEDLKRITNLAESSALENKSIINSEGACSSYSLTNMLLSTTSGFLSSFSKSFFSNQVSVVAGRNREMKVGYDYDLACNFNDLKSPELIGKEAASRAVAQLGARAVKTNKFPVIFEKRAAKELVKSFASAINGNNIASSSSFLLKSLGTMIFNDNICIIDDPLLHKGLWSRPFDGEGVQSRKTICIENGVLLSWILDLHSSKKLNLKTTGNASRMSNASVLPEASNFYIENGHISYNDLIQTVKQGIYVTDLFGFGINLINGDYSQGASGFFIENGIVTYPIHEFTIASNLIEMFGRLIVADDLSFYGQFNSPTIKIDEMIVAGT
ncbi:TldD/PmbA family protein [Wolbachia endosymbiont of Pentidionis agamae]|uniref:TldD/PmbA family protein n=1 Tax=Wolbachia endosymbiont of Pentidionis agamae TaxID=3110435 RepID=UPI002FD6EA06